MKRKKKKKIIEEDSFREVLRPECERRTTELDIFCNRHSTRRAATAAVRRDVPMCMIEESACNR